MHVVNNLIIMQTGIMLRKIYSIILVVSFITMDIFVVIGWRQHMIDAEATPTSNGEQHHQQQPQEQQFQASILVDTKYWARNTQFGERDNWRDQLKPCTLLERIEMNEEGVVSMGDSFDALAGALEANIKELTLAMDGVLLMEEDTFNDQLDPMFVQYLNQSGDCFEHDAETTNRPFVFEPRSDHMSWFNPANWASDLNVDEITHLLPDSHLIPCADDVVIFGSRHAALWPLLEASERAHVMSFKVNFRPSEAMQDNLSSVEVDNIRVSKLLIGDKSYSQQEFNELIRMDSYENILFELDDNRSALKPKEGFSYQTHPVVTIDESSIVQTQSDSMRHVCQDEAGCLCGNEDDRVMKLICSFNYPLEGNDFPCNDPVKASGHCNNICATVITIIMDPTRFSERHVANILYKLLIEDDESQYFIQTTFTDPRRVEHNKFEIILRPVPNDGSNREIIGRDREFAELISERLSNPATKSFYGIKSINIRSSIDWKRSNRWKIFWVSFGLSMLVTTLLSFYQGHCSSFSSGNFINFQFRGDTWFRSADTPILDESKSHYDDEAEMAGLEDSSSEIALVELDSASTG